MGLTKKELKALRPGDKVVLSHEGAIAGIQRKALMPFGHVVAVNIECGLVKVRKWKQKTASWYAREFWMRYPMDEEP